MNERRPWKWSWIRCWFLFRSKWKEPILRLLSCQLLCPSFQVKPTHTDTPLFVRVSVRVVWQSQISRKAIMLLGKGTVGLFPMRLCTSSSYRKPTRSGVSFATSTKPRHGASSFNFSQLAKATEVNTKCVAYCVRNVARPLLPITCLSRLAANAKW